MDSRIEHGDCRDIMRAMDEDSVDAIVTDPPYGLKFMGKRWDCSVPGVDVWVEALRVLKPGGHLLAFAGTRTQHRMCCAIEDAGFEIRDMLAWVYGSGFPKSLDVSKAIDKAAGVERETVANPLAAQQTESPDKTRHQYRYKDCTHIQPTPATPEAARWQGWGTALKPALEPITMARKPFLGTVAANVLEHGTGAINVDGCRVGDTVETRPSTRSYAPGQIQPGGRGQTQQTGEIPSGRWPANLIHDGSDEVRAGFPDTTSGTLSPHHTHQGSENACMSGPNYTRHPRREFRGDSGSASRFFYCAKASQAERDAGCEDRNGHPTVKPVALMAYLVRLITPPGGTVLDPFAGSGTTGIACKQEGFGFIGCELDAEYVEIARKRIDVPQQARLM
jgi:site-specific DNA-methyltransferase (adenine-specific)